MQTGPGAARAARLKCRTRAAEPIAFRAAKPRRETTPVHSPDAGMLGLSCSVPRDPAVRESMLHNDPTPRPQSGRRIRRLAFAVHPPRGAGPSRRLCVPLGIVRPQRPHRHPRRAGPRRPARRGRPASTQNAYGIRTVVNFDERPDRRCRGGDGGAARAPTTSPCPPTPCLHEGNVLRSSRCCTTPGAIGPSTSIARTAWTAPAWRSPRTGSSTAGGPRTTHWPSSPPPVVPPRIVLPERPAVRPSDRAAVEAVGRPPRRFAEPPVSGRARRCHTPRRSPSTTPSDLFSRGLQNRECRGARKPVKSRSL